MMSRLGRFGPRSPSPAWAYANRNMLINSTLFGIVPVVIAKICYTYAYLLITINYPSLNRHSPDIE